MDSNTERDPRTYAIIGSAMEVHSVLGPGFLEPVYTHALLIEFRSRGVPVLTEVPFPVTYKNYTLPTHYRADFVCFESVVVEIKAMSAKSGGIEAAQMINTCARRACTTVCCSILVERNSSIADSFSRLVERRSPNPTHEVCAGARCAGSFGSASSDHRKGPSPNRSGWR